MIHKAQAGHKKEDLIAGLCRAVASNYLNNVGKGKQLVPPVVFQGSVSKNKGAIEAFKLELGAEICVDTDSHLMGALGAAVLAKAAPARQCPFGFEAQNIDFSTKAYECAGCANNCEIVQFFRGKELIDCWGRRCEGS